MRNSLIFFKTSNSAKSYAYQAFDCCEGLGDSFRSRNMGKVMYVAIPIAEMDEFFLIDDKRNLLSYLKFISETFSIDYTLSTEEDIKNVSEASFGYERDACVFVTVVSEKARSNKYFNSAYNIFRYLWYQMYTPMAIIATNLYNLQIIKDNVDILAIMQSYQAKGDRALLQGETLPLKGLLFFRPFEDCAKELQNNRSFNGVFLRYPIYFDPEVKIKGSFFEDAEAILKAKDLFGKLVGVVDVNDIPKSMKNNIALIYEDYLLMKEQYLYIKKELDTKNYSINFSNPVLLSKKLTTVKISAVDATGTGRSIQINILPQQETKFSAIDREFGFSEKVNLPF